MNNFLHPDAESQSPIEEYQAEDLSEQLAKRDPVFVPRKVESEEQNPASLVEIVKDHLLLTLSTIGLIGVNLVANEAQIEDPSNLEAIQNLINENRVSFMGILMLTALADYTRAFLKESNLTIKDLLSYLK